MEESPCRPKRNSVGTADGCPVGRCSGSLSLLPNLPSPVSAMGSLRRNEEGSASACPRPQGPRCPGRPGSLYRRELRSGEKGGSKVGKTKRGKGTKIMAVADRHGLPVCAPRSIRRRRRSVSKGGGAEHGDAAGATRQAYN